jgi:hypothetical protein
VSNPGSGAAALIASLFANPSGPSGGATPAAQTLRASSAPRPRRVADDDLVFEDIPTRPDAVSTARFGDDVWDFAPVITLPGEAETSNIHFTDIGDPAARLAAKEFGWARLRFDLTGHGTPKAITVRSELRYLKAVYRDLEALFGIQRWADVTQDHLDRFLPMLRHAKGGSVAAVRNSVIALQRLAMARQHLSDDTLLVDPWGYQKADVIAGYVQPMDNLTPEVPAPVLAPLLQWAEHYVTVWADEIIAALARAERPAPAWSVVGPTRKIKGAVDVRREAYLAHLRRTGVACQRVPAAPSRHGQTSAFRRRGTRTRWTSRQTSSASRWAIAGCNISGCSRGPGGPGCWTNSARMSTWRGGAHASPACSRSSRRAAGGSSGTMRGRKR